MSNSPTEEDYIQQVVCLLDGIQNGRNAKLTEALLNTLVRHYSKRFGPTFTSRGAEDALKAYRAHLIEHREATKAAKEAAKKSLPIAQPAPKPVKPKLTPEHFTPVAVTVKRLKANDFDANNAAVAGQRRLEILRHLVEGAVLVHMLPSEAKKLDDDTNFKSRIPGPAEVIKNLPGLSELYERATDVEKEKILRRYGPTNYLDRYKAKGIYCIELSDYLSQFYK